MSCRDIDLFLRETFAPSRLPAELKQHAMECERCHRMVLAFDDSPLEDLPSPMMLSEIESRLLAKLTPVQPIASSLQLLAALLAILVFGSLLFGYAMRPSGLAVLSMAQMLTMLLVLVSAGALLAYSLVRQMVPGSPHFLPVAFPPFIVLASLLLALALQFDLQAENHFWAHSLVCFSIGSAVALATLLPVWFTLRRGAWLSPAVTGAASALLAGLVGVGALEIHCPNLNLAHIAVGHLGVALVFAVLGYTAGALAEMMQRTKRVEL